MTTPQRHIIKKRTVRYSLQIVLPLAIFAIFAVNLEPSHIKSLDLDFRYAIPAMASLGFSYFMRALFLFSVLGPPPKLLGFFAITAVYSWLAVIFPAGLGHAGLPLLLKRHYGVEAEKGVSALMVFNLARILLLGILLAAIFFAGKAEAVPVAWRRPRLGLEIFGFALVAGFLLFLILRRRQFSERFPLIGKMSGFLLAVGTAIRGIPRNRIAPLLMISLVAEGLNILTFGFFFSLAGAPLPLLIVIMVYCLLNISFVIPIHGVAGLGSFEAIVIFVLMGRGIDYKTAIAVSVLVHLAQLTTRTAIMIPCQQLLGRRLRKKERGFQTS